MLFIISVYSVTGFTITFSDTYITLHCSCQPPLTLSWPPLFSLWSLFFPNQSIYVFVSCIFILSNPGST